MVSGVLIISVCAVFVHLLIRMVFRQGIRDAVLGSWLALALFVFAVSEMLSLFGRFKPSFIRGAWLLAGLSVVVCVAFGCRSKAIRLLKDDFQVCRKELAEGLRLFPVAFPVAALILFLTFVHAVAAPSFDVDSLSYHLPRATHWLVNGSVRFYETAIFRQNFQAPLYSMCLAHLMALTGSDIFLNLLQWIALIVNAVALTLIAAELGVAKKWQWFAALYSATIPQALSQVIVCVNDLFAATAVSIFVLYLIRFLRRSAGTSAALMAALAMGIAFIAKYTSLIHVAGLAVPLSIFGLIRTWRGASFGQFLRQGFGLAGIIVAGFVLLVPQVTRNMRAYGDPFSGEPPNLMTNTNLTAKKFAVNYVKNLSMHAAFPLYRLNAPLERAVKRFSGALTEDPDISFQNDLCFTDYRIFTPLGKYSSNASNPVQLFCYMGLLAAIVMTGFRGGALIFEYSVIPVFFGSLLYAAVFKFQPWCARLHLPYFMLMGMGVALWLSGRRSGGRAGGVIMAVSLAYAVLHVLLFSDWYMPSFLFGRAPRESGLGADASLVQKMRYLHREGWPKEDIREMRQSVPPVLAGGYSIFFTERDRLYLGNQYHDDMSWRYGDTVEAVGYVQRRTEEKGVSPCVGLLISSDHGNLFPEEASFADRPFSWEFVLWRMIGNITGEGKIGFRHFGAGDPAGLSRDYFGSERGLILSDDSRNSVLERLSECVRFERVFSNRTFSVYCVGSVLEARDGDGGNRIEGGRE